MNIRCLYENLTCIKEIKAIGKNVKLNDVICNVMGIVRRGTELRLLILRYDESFQRKIEENESTEWFDNPVSPKTNRLLLRGDREIYENNPFHSVLKVFIGENEFEVDYLEQQRLNTQDWESLMIIIKFLNAGWQADEIDYQDINMLFLTSIKLNGDYNSIPDFNQNSELHFVMGPQSVAHLVEKPITLPIGGIYPEKLTFQDAMTGEEHWVQINRVYLADMWEETDKIFSNPKFQEQMSSEELVQMRLDFENKLLEICPKGMYFPVIEYECEEDISLQFYSKAFLDAKPVQKSSSMGFIIRPDKSEGILGFRLKAAVIQEPVPVNTVAVEAELFQYIHTTAGRDIVLK